MIGSLIICPFNPISSNTTPPGPRTSVTPSGLTIVSEPLNLGPGVPTAGFGSDTCGPTTAPASSAGASTFGLPVPTNVAANPPGFVGEPGPDTFGGNTTSTTGSCGFFMNPFGFVMYPGFGLGTSVDFLIFGLGGATTGVDGFGSGTCTVV